MRLAGSPQLNDIRENPPQRELFASGENDVTLTKEGRQKIRTNCSRMCSIDVNRIEHHCEY